MAGVTVLHNSISPIIETRNVHRGKKLLKDVDVMDMVQQFIVKLRHQARVRQGSARDGP